MAGVKPLPFRQLRSECGARFSSGIAEISSSTLPRLVRTESVCHIMRILAIETIEQSGSVAALDGGSLVMLQKLDAKQRSAVTVAPAIVALLSAVDWRPADVRLVAVAFGPGSFTGLRVGVTTAKMFAYGVKADILGVNTLEAIAYQSAPSNKSLWTVLDALRDQVFVGRFTCRSAGDWQSDGAAELLDNSVWLARIAPGDLVSGPGLIKLESHLPAGVTIVDCELWFPTAASVGQVAWRGYQAGRRDDVFSILPQYFRPSAAEEKRVLRLQQQTQQQQ